MANAAIDSSAPSGAKRLVIGSSHCRRVTRRAVPHGQVVPCDTVSAKSYRERNRRFHQFRRVSQCAKRKTGPLRVRFELVGAGADHHLPEGNNCRSSIAIWEDGQPIADSDNCSMPTTTRPTTRTPACQPCEARNLIVLVDDPSTETRCVYGLEMPALRLRYQEIAKHLHARDRL